MTKNFALTELHMAKSNRLLKLLRTKTMEILVLQVPYHVANKFIHPDSFVFKQVQTGTQSHFVSQLHISQVVSTALGGQVLPISVPPSETEMLDSIISTFPTTDSTFTQKSSTDTVATTKKRRSPEPEGDESQKQDTVKRTRASAKKNQTTTELGQDASVFTPPDDPEALTEQDEASAGAKRQRGKRGANGSVTPAQAPKATASTTRRKRGGGK